MIRNLWRGITASRYTAGLEAEVARLRAENRALLNSILGIAGVPPVTVVAEAAVVAARRGAGAPSDTAAAASDKAGAPNDKTAAAKSGARIAAPTRRRSWQQINRMLERESARKT